MRSYSLPPVNRLLPILATTALHHVLMLRTHGLRQAHTQLNQTLSWVKHFRADWTGLSEEKNTTNEFTNNWQPHSFNLGPSLRE
jgi:cell division protein FtsL